MIFVAIYKSKYCVFTNPSAGDRYLLVNYIYVFVISYYSSATTVGIYHVHACLFTIELSTKH